MRTSQVTALPPYPPMWQNVLVVLLACVQRLGNPFSLAVRETNARFVAKGRKRLGYRGYQVQKLRAVDVEQVFLKLADTETTGLPPHNIQPLSPDYSALLPRKNTQKKHRQARYTISRRF